MIKIGLVGIPKSGKSTIFNAVTKSSAERVKFINKSFTVLVQQPISTHPAACPGQEIW